ncbi:MAG: hypothetical protein AAGC91_01155 [Pseudomonadota bacterium]
MTAQLLSDIDRQQQACCHLAELDALLQVALDTEGRHQSAALWGCQALTKIAKDLIDECGESTNA